MSEVQTPQTTREYLERESFYLPEPLPPSEDKRARQLRWPIYAALFGLFCLAVLGYSFVELSVMPQWFHTGLVIAGAFSLAAGSEFGTYATTGEVFRKVGAGKALVWDWLALVVSLCATVLSLLLAYGTLMDVKSAWPGFITLWGPLLAVLATALDAYAGLSEYGLYCATYDKRYQVWEQKYHSWCENIAIRDGLAVNLVSSVQLAPEDDALVLEQPAPVAPVTEPAPAGLAHLTPDERRERLLALWSEHPRLTQADAGDMFGVSRQTIGADYRQLAEAGRVRRNGHGIEVLEEEVV